MDDADAVDVLGDDLDGGLRLPLTDGGDLQGCIDPLNSCTGVIVEGNDDEYPDGRRYQALDGQA